MVVEGKRQDWTRDPNGAAMHAIRRGRMAHGGIGAANGPMVAPRR